jgi:hypothetical protein
MRDYHPPPFNGPEDHHIEAGNATLMRQAQMTAQTYMSQAIEDIDELFGDGYAKKHPELIVGYMQTAAIDLGTAIIARAIEYVETQAGFERRAASDSIDYGDPPS